MINSIDCATAMVVFSAEMLCTTALFNFPHSPASCYSIELVEFSFGSTVETKDR